MFHNATQTQVSPAPSTLHVRRSLSGEFVFVSQDDSVAFAAEACIDVLRSANRLIGLDGYSWTHHAGSECMNAGPVCGPDQTLVLIGGMEEPWLPNPAYLTQIKASIRNAARVCVVGSAVFVPLAAGVLGAKQLSVHPNFRPGVRESGRLLDVIETSTCHHKALSSAISPAAAVRMMVELVGARDGEYTRSSLARYLGLSDPEDDSSMAEHWRYTRLAQGHPVISEALKLMAEHLEDTLSVGQIADLLDVSPRKLERGFRDLLNRTPLKVYRDLRLDRARRLLAQTALPLSEVSMACGFSSAGLMKKWFVEKYGEVPDQVRQAGFGAMAHA